MKYSGYQSKKLWGRNKEALEYIWYITKLIFCIHIYKKYIQYIEFICVFMFIT